MTGTGTITRAQVQALGGRLAGSAVKRGDPCYSEASASRFPNLEVPWEPDIVVNCARIADVQVATTFASEHGLGVAVRGGGVGWPGARPGMLLLDLRELDGIAVDHAGGSVRAQGGGIWRDVQRALGGFGLAAAGPQFPSLGAGYALGGGHGWLSSKLGWGADNLLAADVVTADGDLVHVSAEEESDLFWALRGAGANFGVAVTLEFATIPLETVTFGSIWFHPRRTAAALEAYREWIVHVPDELTTIVSVAHPPAELPIPVDQRGAPCCHILLCHCGTAAQAEFDLAPIQRHPDRIASTVARMRWSTVASAPDPFPANVHRRSRLHYVSGMTDEVIATTVARTEAMGELSFMSTHYYGGALRRVDEHATAMGHRDQAWNYMVTASWRPGEIGEPLRDWQEEYLHEISAGSTGAYYVNYLFDEPEHVRAAYNPTTWNRLRALKRVWDPENLFAANHNVPPDAT